MLIIRPRIWNYVCKQAVHVHVSLSVYWPFYILSLSRNWLQRHLDSNMSPCQQKLQNSIWGRGLKALSRFEPVTFNCQAIIQGIEVALNLPWIVLDFCWCKTARAKISGVLIIEKFHVSLRNIKLGLFTFDFQCGRDFPSLPFPCQSSGCLTDLTCNKSYFLRH